MKLIFSKHKKDVLIYAVLTVLLSIAMVSEAYWMQLIIDAIKSGNRRYILISIVIAIFLLIQTILYFFQQFQAATLSKKCAYTYRNSIFKRMQCSPIRVLTGEKSDKLLASLTTQIDQIEFNYFYSLFWGGYLICQLLVAIVISLYVNPLMAILTIILSFPNLIVAIVFKKPLEKKQEGLIETTHVSTATIQNLIEGISDWKNANAQLGIFKLFSDKTAKLLKDQIKVEKSQYIVVTLNQFFSNVLYFGSWIFGGYLIMNSHLTLGAMIAFSQLLVRISYPVYASSDLLARYISGRKILETLSKEFSVTDMGVTLQEKIRKIVLDDFTLVDKPNQNAIKAIFSDNGKYLLKGKSGSGKTTILKSILKENDDYGGRIMINGIDARAISEESIFDNIAYISQHPHLFNGSLKENVTLFSEDYSDEQIYKTLEFVELAKWANEDSLKMILSNDERKLSGGEIKRVSLARALLRGKDVLLLDEFSSGIDHLTLMKIEKKLFDLNKMIIYVTHVYTEELSKKFDGVIDLDEL